MPKNLLLADDSITIQKVVGITFAGEDFKITAVDNGEDAIARARELRPDVILADVVMPRKNGYEVCETVKGDPALRHIPVLLLAGTFEAFDESRARAARADGHIAKPFESQALITRVKELLASAAPGAVPAERPAEKPAAPPVAQARAPAAAPPPGPRPPIAQVPAAFAARPADLGRAPAIPTRPLGVPSVGVPPTSARPAATPLAARPKVSPAPDLGRPAGPPPSARPPLPQRPPLAAPAPPPKAVRPPVEAPRENLPVPPAVPAPPPAVERTQGLPFVAPLRPLGKVGAPAEASRKAAPEPSRAPDAVDLDFSDLDVTETGELAAPASAPAKAPPAARPAAKAFEAKPPLEPPVPDAALTSLEDIDFGLPSQAAAPLAPAEPPPEPDLPLLEVDEEVELVPVGEAAAGGEALGSLSPLDLGGPPPEAAPARPPERAAPPPAAAADQGGERELREALSRASREVIERIAWEVVPELAETIIREHLDRLVKARQG